ERHWGRFGAAGLFLLHGERLLMQHRAHWSHHGGTWAIPGGARMEGETAVAAALREAAEEAAVPADLVTVGDRHVLDHGSWSYTTVVATTAEGFDAHPTDAESLALAWVPLGDVPGRPLHPAFAGALPELRVLVAAIY